MRNTIPWCSAVGPGLCVPCPGWWWPLCWLVATLGTRDPPPRAQEDLSCVPADGAQRARRTRRTSQLVVRLRRGPYSLGRGARCAVLMCVRSLCMACL